MDLEPKWSEVTTVFGGTFDPPHLSHRQTVEGLLKHPGVGQVIIVPSGVPPLKKTNTSLKHRKAMIEICFKPLLGPKVTYDWSEFYQAELSPTTATTSYDTLSRLAEKYSSLACAIGIDQLALLPKWKHFPEVLDLCHWIIIERKPHTREGAVRLLKEFERNNWLVDVDTAFKVVATPALEQSSTEIRKSGTSTGIPELDHYLSENKLYQKNQA